MESGLVGRNNDERRRRRRNGTRGLNGVRPSWPEQLVCLDGATHHANHGLNGVRPSWPEQSVARVAESCQGKEVSMESGLVGRNNPA